MDGLRGLAILAVVFCHYFGLISEFRPGTAGAYFAKILGAGWMGVDLFFVLSGFLVGGILIDQKKAKNYFRIFWMRRALRIAPPYFLFLAAYGLAISMPEGFWKGSESWLWRDALPFWALAGYLQNFVMTWNGNFGPNFTAITWSLAVEEQFYLLFPLIVWCLPSRKILPVVLAFFFAAPVFRLTTGLWLNPEAARQAAIVLLPARCDCLAAGIVVAILVRNPGLAARLKTYSLSIQGATVAGLCTLLAFPFANLGQNSPATLGFGFSWIAIVGAGLVLCLHERFSPSLCKIFGHPILRYFGKISYSLYLFHMAFLLILWALVFREPPAVGSPRDVFFAILALASAIGFSHLCWILFESRLIRFGHRFSYQL